MRHVAERVNQAATCAQLAIYDSNIHASHFALRIQSLCFDLYLRVHIHSAARPPHLVLLFLLNLRAEAELGAQEGYEP